jgi:hypothetical protein
MRSADGAPQTGGCARAGRCGAISLRVSCRVSEYDVGGVVDRFRLTGRLRRDGLLEARSLALDGRRFVLEFD